MARRGDGIYQRGKGKIKTWWMDVVINGVRHQKRLGKGITRTVALEVAQVQRGAILKGELGIGKKKKDIGFEEARQKFEQWAKADKKPRTVKAYKECLRRLAESFSGKRLSEISAFAVEGHKQKRIHAGALVRCNRELAVLRHLFNKATAWGLYEGGNPLDAVKPLKEPKAPERYLEPEEDARLLAHSREPYRSLYEVLLNTGLRAEAEALTLQWPSVDFRLNVLTVEAAYAKNGKTRTIPINSRARGVLLSLKASAQGPYVFCKRNGEPYKSIEKPFAKACQRAGLQDVTPHTLRHTWASRLVEAGVDLRMLMELGGWSSLKMVERYAHVNPKRKAEAVERLATEFPYAIPYGPSEIAVVPLADRPVSA